MAKRARISSLVTILDLIISLLIVLRALERFGIMVHDNGELCEQPKFDIVSESIWLSGSSLVMLLGLHFCF